jgi:hypothetical protein
LQIGTYLSRWAQQHHLIGRAAKLHDHMIVRQSTSGAFCLLRGAAARLATPAADKHDGTAHLAAPWRPRLCVARRTSGSASDDAHAAVAQNPAALENRETTWRIHMLAVRSVRAGRSASSASRAVTGRRGQPGARQPGSRSQRAICLRTRPATWPCARVQQPTSVTQFKRSSWLNENRANSDKKTERIRFWKVL